MVRRPGKCRHGGLWLVAATGGRVAVYGYLFDAKNPDSPQVLGKQYNETASQDNARLIAHRFADEIITRLGGGISGIAETHIYYVAKRGGNKEIWQMDYDGQGQHAVTHLGTISLSPRSRRITTASPLLRWNAGLGDSHVLARARPSGRLSLHGGQHPFPGMVRQRRQDCFFRSRAGDPEIFTADANGANVKQITTFKGPDVSPTWNPKTNSQIAWCSGRTGLPQIYMMEADGTSVQRLTDGGYATSPSWSPNGQFLAFAWNRKYGPGAPGGQDIYIMDIASKRWTQLTHEEGRQRLPFLVPRRAAHRISARKGWRIRDLDHACRWYGAASSHPRRRFDAQLELEVAVLASWKTN